MCLQGLRLPLWGNLLFCFVWLGYKISILSWEIIRVIKVHLSVWFWVSWQWHRVLGTTNSQILDGLVWQFICVFVHNMCPWIFLTKVHFSRFLCHNTFEYKIVLSFLTKKKTRYNFQHPNLKPKPIEFYILILLPVHPPILCACVRVDFL